jgi:hypothetical protein
VNVGSNIHSRTKQEHQTVVQISTGKKVDEARFSAFLNAVSPSKFNVGIGIAPRIHISGMKTSGFITSRDVNAQEIYENLVAHGVLIKLSSPT